MLTCIFVNDYVKFCMMWWRAANDKEIPYHWNKAYGHVQTMWRKFYYSLCWHSSRIRISSSICTNLNVAVQPPSSSPVLSFENDIEDGNISREIWSIQVERYLTNIWSRRLIFVRDDNVLRCGQEFWFEIKKYYSFKITFSQDKSMILTWKDWLSIF